MESTEKASEALSRWLKGVLAEHGLSVADIYSSTSDSGSGIKRVLNALLPAEWTWCVPHMANRVFMDALGLEEVPAGSHYKAAMEVTKK